MAITAVLFDLDGTLIDSVPDIAAALNEALVPAGHDALSLAAVTGIIGGGSRALIARALGGEALPSAIDDVHAAFLSAYSARPLLLTRPYDGALETLQTLVREGVQLGVCTNKPEPLTHAILEGLGWGELFGSVVGGLQGQPAKPDAVPVRRALAMLDAAPCSSVMVGDSRADAGAARAAGCRSILVRHGYEHAPLENLGADRIIEGLCELPAAIGSLCD